MRRTSASRLERIQTSLGVCRKTTASPGKRRRLGTPPSQQRESSTKGMPPAATLSLAISISFLAHGFRMGLVVSAMRFCARAPPRCWSNAEPGKFLSMMGPGPVSPGTLRNAVPLDKTHVLPFDEKSGIALLGLPAGCAWEFVQTSPAERTSPAKMLPESVRLSRSRVLIEGSFALVALNALDR